MKYIIIGVVIFLSVNLSAQTIQRSVICVNGNYVENGGLKVSQTIGEPIAETFNGPDITTLIVQGFEQQFGSLLTVGINEIQFEVNVYPNPTTDFVFLDFQQELPTTLQLQVFGVDGKFYFDQTLLKNTKVNLSELAASTYFLTIIDSENKRILKAIPIQKLK